MTLLTRRGDYGSLLDRFNSNDFFNSLGILNDYNNMHPSVNIVENENDYSIELAAPSFEKDDFNIEYHKGTLTVSAEKRTENEEKDEKRNYLSREFSYSKFSRSFTVPKEKIDEENIQAKYENGVLYITLQKQEEAKQQEPYKISIS